MARNGIVFVFIITLVVFCLTGCDIVTNDWIDNNNVSANANDIEDDYQFEVVDDVIKLIFHKDSSAESIVVSENVAEKPVEILGSDIFYQHTKDLFIQLPENLKTIQGSPFYRCYSLQQMHIPKNVRGMNANPFLM